jgi:hypothetical protein
MFLTRSVIINFVMITYGVLLTVGSLALAFAINCRVYGGATRDRAAVGVAFPGLAALQYGVI